MLGFTDLAKAALAQYLQKKVLILNSLPDGREFSRFRGNGLFYIIAPWRFSGSDFLRTGEIIFLYHSVFLLINMMNFNYKNENKI